MRNGTTTSLDTVLTGFDSNSPSVIYANFNDCLKH